MPEYEDVRTEVSDRVGTITVDRPAAMNAVNPGVLRELASAGAEFMADDDVRVLVVTGAGEDAFVGGGDLKDFQNRPATWFRQEFRDAVSGLQSSLEEGRKPVIAAVNGVALGGGTEIATMCDMVVAAESARFGVPESNLGLIPGSSGTQRLTHLVGYLKAKELVLTGRHVPAPEAADIGLANEVVPDDDLYDRVYDLAGDLAEGAPYAQWFGKEAVNQARANFETGLRLEETLAAILFETADKEEGIEAFLEKRDPDFGDLIDWDERE